MCTKTIIFLFLNQNIVVGTQKNCPNETVLLSTQNICSKWWIRKYLQFYAQKFCLSKPMDLISTQSYSHNAHSSVWSRECFHHISIFCQSNGAFSLFNMDSSREWKTVWILISWLLMKPADQDPHCFQKFVSVCNSYGHSALRERSGSVVECLTWDREAAGSSLTSVTALWFLSLAKYWFNPGKLVPV